MIINKIRVVFSLMSRNFLMTSSQMQLVCIATVLAVATVAETANILGLFPTTGMSAFAVSEAIMKGLAKRGHNVTVLSCFPQPANIENYTDISIRHLRSVLNGSHRLDNFENLPLSILDLNDIFLPQIEGMDVILRSNEFQSLLSSNVMFDVVFHEMFVDNVFLLVARKFKAPIIAVGASYMLPWAGYRFGVPDNPAYIPVISNSFKAKMSFSERLVNTVSYIRSNLAYWTILVPKSNEVYTRHFKEVLPSISEAAKSISMYLVNTHFSYYGARPYPPQVVEIGGIQLQPDKILPKDLAEWMENRNVIYFSFGSILKGASLHREKIDVLFEVFGKLQYSVLWKWEDDKEENMPHQVKVMKWLPQKDVLAHPNTKLFISHGGLMGTMEAIVHGVPILGIPTNMDQANNVACLQDFGVAVHIDYNNITVTSMAWAINELLTNKEYATNAAELSRRFLDRPMSPLDTAVYWTEYVIRHKGAPHLQSAAVHLTWYQYYLLDVLAVITLALLVILSIMYFVIKYFMRYLVGKKYIKEKCG